MLHRHQLVEIVSFESPSVNYLAPVGIEHPYELAFLELCSFALPSRDFDSLA